MRKRWEIPRGHSKLINLFYFAFHFFVLKKWTLSYPHTLWCHINTFQCHIHTLQCHILILLCHVIRMFCHNHTLLAQCVISSLCSVITTTAVSRLQCYNRKCSVITTHYSVIITYCSQSLSYLQILSAIFPESIFYRFY